MTNQEKLNILASDFRKLDENCTSNGYNIVDVDLETQSGFTAATGDTTVAAKLGSNTTTPFANTTTFEPKSQLRNILPSTPIADFPLMDFNGVTRTWPGAPGAVK